LISGSCENLYLPENGRNNNELKTVQINSKVTQIMTPTVNVNEHTTYTNLLHILHNRLSEAQYLPTNLSTLLHKVMLGN